MATSKRKNTNYMAKPYSFKLNRAEKASSAWKKTQEHFEYLLQRERKKNDNRQEADDTAAIRGKIGLLKELIKLNDAVAPSEQDDDSEEE
jgi:hypothetical protein